MILKEYDKRFKNLDMLDDDMFTIAHDKDYKLLIVIFRNDACQTHPHFHVIDYATLGNRINAAYHIESGRYMLHGSVIRPLSSKNIKTINNLIRERSEEDNFEIWKAIKNIWNYENNLQIDSPIVNITNNDPIAITQQYLKLKKG